MSGYKCLQVLAKNEDMRLKFMYYLEYLAKLNQTIKDC